MIIHEVLVDRHRVAPAGERRDDQLAIRLTGTGARRTGRRPPARVGGHLGRNGRIWPREVGGHLRSNGRICRPFAPAATPAHTNPRRAEVAADRFSAHTRRRLDAPEGPAQAPQRQNLLLLLFVQDVAHPGEGP